LNGPRYGWLPRVGAGRQRGEVHGPAVVRWGVRVSAITRDSLGLKPGGCEW
jgi:hypothetical protein